jgi:molybdopterin molybdotransferase
MIEVSEAVKIINETQLSLTPVKIPLEKAVGRVLRQDIIADTDFPPFDRVMMDGIAVKWEDFENGIRTFKIEGVQAAGSPKMKLQNRGGCLEAMTGAIAPENADLVIPYEDVRIDRKENLAVVNIGEASNGSNVHKSGADKKRGELLVPVGTMIGTPEIAIAASVGRHELLVTRHPTIAIVSTGNELVDVDEKPLPHQIRRSNVYAIAAELRKMGIKSDLMHIHDDKSALRQSLGEILERYDIVMLSGGISQGKFDFVPETLESLGVVKKFHQVKQKPGKPFLFAVREDRNVVFAFPGNPVSTFMCFHKYFIPWLKSNLGIREAMNKKAVLNQDFSIKTSFTYFLQVASKIDDHGTFLATPVMGGGSGDHANLLNSNAFLELPANTYHFKKGQVFNLIPFRDI